MICSYNEFMNLNDNVIENFTIQVFVSNENQYNEILNYYKINNNISIYKIY